MKILAASSFAFLVSLAALPAEPVLRNGTGFYTMDVYGANWASLQEDQKLHGDVGATLKFEGVSDIYVLRVLMHLRDLGEIKELVKRSLAPGQSFSKGPLPTKEQGLLHPLVTVMLVTRDKKTALLSVFDSWALLECGDRCGLIVFERGDSAKN